MENGVIKIAIVDDHRIVRDGIKALLIGSKNIKLLDSFGDPLSYLKWLDEGSNNPNITLMDIAMPQMSGIELARKVNQDSSKNQKIIILTANTARHFLEASLKAGAKGFLSKDCEKEELISAIEQVYSGHYYIDRSLNQDMVRNYISALEYATPDRDLTEREVDIVRGFANGLSYQEIAEELNISKKTVETHKRSIFDKLNISNNADLVKYAIRNKIVEL